VREDSHAGGRASQQFRDWRNQRLKQVILAKVTKADQEEFRPEELVECEAANERVDE